jgi:hypothetical protein
MKKGLLGGTLRRVYRGDEQRESRAAVKSHLTWVAK